MTLFYSIKIVGGNYGFTGLYNSMPTRDDVKVDIDKQTLPLDGKTSLKNVVDNVRLWPKNLPVSRVAVVRDKTGRKLGTVTFELTRKQVLR
jgi:hypothetical protein